MSTPIAAIFVNNWILLCLCRRCRFVVPLLGRFLFCERKCAEPKPDPALEIVKPRKRCTKYSCVHRSQEVCCEVNVIWHSFFVILVCPSWTSWPEGRNMPRWNHTCFFLFVFLSIWSIALVVSRMVEVNAVWRTKRLHHCNHIFITFVQRSIKVDSSVVQLQRIRKMNPKTKTTLPKIASQPSVHDRIKRRKPESSSRIDRSKYTPQEEASKAQCTIHHLSEEDLWLQFLLLVTRRRWRMYHHISLTVDSPSSPQLMGNWLFTCYWLIGFFLICHTVNISWVQPLWDVLAQVGLYESVLSWEVKQSLT